MTDHVQARRPDAPSTLAVHAVSAASPELDAATMRQLEESIRAIGQQVPILVWRGEVIDGRKRLAACQAIGVAPVVTVLPDDAPAPQLASDLNLIRTHYSAAQRAVYAAKVANLSHGGPRVGQVSQDSLAPPVSSAQAAQAFAVHPRTVNQAKRLTRTAAPEVVAAVERGELSLARATRIAEGTPKADQARAVHEAVRGTKPAPAATTRGVPRRDPDAIRQKALETMHGVAAVLDQFADAPVRAAQQVPLWIDWIDDLTRTLRTLRKHLEVAHAQA